MKLERFDEWFAVRVGNSDDNIWPGRLVYDPSEGIELETTNFAGPEYWYGHPGLNENAITGYFDYQNPTSIIRPFRKSSGPIVLGNSHQLRAKFKFGAKAVLKNIHLSDVSEKMFTGLEIELPSFQAWIARDVVVRTRRSPDQPAIEIAEPVNQSIVLKNGIRVEIDSFAGMTGKGEERLLRDLTRLSLTLVGAVDFDSILKIAFILDLTFAFMVGTRLESAVPRFVTTKKRLVGEQEVSVLAEAWFVPWGKRNANLPDFSQRMYTEKNSNVDTEKILEFCTGQNDHMWNLMDVVLAAESRDKTLDESFIDLVGSLEEFDGQACRADVGAGTAKRQTLKQRLERLIAYWRNDGFRGDPSLDLIVSLRNKRPHGRAYELSQDDYQTMSHLMLFLCGLARYHILRFLGYEVAEIAGGFKRCIWRYGMFVPEVERA